MATHVLVLLGTKKGAFLLEGDAARTTWQLRGPFCEAWPIYHMTYDETSQAIYAGGGNPWFGPAVWRSPDRGATWSHSGAGLTYGEAGPTLNTIWHITPTPDVLYAGAEPAGLFASVDQGATWTHVAGLREHPSSAQWQPGYGGLCLHSIVAHPTDKDRLWVAISSVGTFATEDGGATWVTRNQGVRAEFSPERYPEYGQCVHKLLLAADGAQLYQQNHCGVYRSDDGGVHWQEITAGLPSDFGFPLALHPRDPNTLYVVPLNGADRGRYVPEGRMIVWRSADRGDSWTPQTQGLPAEHAYLSVLREGMAVDTLDPMGMYVGTSTGHVFGSSDEGESWQQICTNLPPILSVETALVEL
ncbi:MAG: exo-alpha-sialidase [Ktedonobacterales bacterium]|nr:exo-alpha-sialidase [Ktedonobacterales bacterium]